MDRSTWPGTARAVLCFRMITDLEGLLMLGNRLAPRCNLLESLHLLPVLSSLLLRSVCMRSRELVNFVSCLDDWTVVFNWIPLTTSSFQRALPRYQLFPALIESYLKSFFFITLPPFS